MKTILLKDPRILLCALIILSAALFSGCFMADNKFYRDSDIVTDSHFVGTFMPADAATNKANANCSLVIESETNNHYVATYHEAKNWIKFDVVLFQLGTNHFVDISRLADSGNDPNDRDYPGGPPALTGYKLLRLATGGSQHCAFRVVVNPKTVEFQLAIGNDFMKVVMESPDMKMAPIGNSPRKEPTEFPLLKFTGSTEDLRNFLLKHVSSENALRQKSIFVRSDK